MNKQDPFYITHFNKIIVLIFFILLINFADATTPTIAQIRQWEPRFSDSRATVISLYVDVHTLSNGLNKELLVAILIQESSLRIDAQNYASNDFGIGQINEHTAAYFCPNRARLLTDYDYSIWCAATVLSDFKYRYSRKEKKWWTRYNSSDKIKRRRYGKLVSRHGSIL